MSELKDKPKVFISKRFGAIDNLKEMFDSDANLYDQCISKENFAFHFGQLANKAIHFDYLVGKGFIPKEYMEDLTTMKLFSAMDI